MVIYFAHCILLGALVQVSSSSYVAERSFSSSTCCCEALSSFLPSIVFGPSSGPYNVSQNNYYSELESSLGPDCIVLPRTTEEVSTAVKVLSELYTDGTEHCNFAVRGGGHTPWKGAANIDNGVTIDLSSLNQLKLSADSTVLEVGGGASWGQAYAYLDEKNLSIISGRDSGVGVGGLTLGGGISFFSPRFGFVCDNVESYELVGPFGEIYHEVSESTYPDLYRALKGGSNNFGIVTTFRFRTLSSGQIWGGSVSYDPSTIPQQLKAFSTIAGSQQYDEYASLYLTMDFYAGQTLSSNFYVYTKQPAQNSTPEFLAPLIDIVPRLNSTLRIAPLKNFTDEINASNAVFSSGLRASFTTMTVKNNKDLLLHLYNEAQRVLSPVTKNNANVAFEVVVQPLPQIITYRSNLTGGNVMGITPEDGDLVNAHLPAQWLSPELDELIERTSREFISRARQCAERYGASASQIYLNYANKWQDPIDGYGKENFDFLRNVSMKYDPQGIFQEAESGGFKLWADDGTS